MENQPNQNEYGPLFAIKLAASQYNRSNLHQQSRKVRQRILRLSTFPVEVLIPRPQFELTVQKLRLECTMSF